jgi:hypothetical protein
MPIAVPIPKPFPSQQSPLAKAAQTVHLRILLHLIASGIAHPLCRPSAPHSAAQSVHAYQCTFDCYQCGAVRRGAVAVDITRISIV